MAVRGRGLRDIDPVYVVLAVATVVLLVILVVLLF
jgi:hypothetical protein